MGEVALLIPIQRNLWLAADPVRSAIDQVVTTTSA